MSVDILLNRCLFPNVSSYEKPVKAPHHGYDLSSMENPTVRDLVDSVFQEIQNHRETFLTHKSEELHIDPATNTIVILCTLSPYSPIKDLEVLSAKINFIFTEKLRSFCYPIMRCKRESQFPSPLWNYTLGVIRIPLTLTDPNTGHFSFNFSQVPVNIEVCMRL